MMYVSDQHRLGGKCTDAITALFPMMRLNLFQDNTIVVWFSNRSGSLDTFAGTSAISYEIQCNELPVPGIARTVANWLSAE